MTADQGQYEKFMAKLSKSGLELQKDFSRLSPEIKSVLCKRSTKG